MTEKRRVEKQSRLGVFDVPMSMTILSDVQEQVDVDGKEAFFGIERGGPIQKSTTTFLS